jgi:hypothetical protein
VELRRVHSNAKGYVVKKGVEGAYDWLYILYARGDGFEEHLLPECFIDRRAVTISPSSQIFLEG